MKLIFTLLVVVLSFSTATANEFAPVMEAHLKSTAIEWINNPTVINAIKAQNTKHASLSQSDIDNLDKQWRAGVNGTGDTKLIDTTLSNELSNYLKGVKAEHEPLYTEIFVMDNKGLNVGQSDVTSDYWQGDEGKWKNTFLKGANAIDIGDLEEDESTGAFQSQLNAAIVDSNGNVIGAVTIGISVDSL